MPNIDVTWIGSSLYAAGTGYGPYTTAGYEFVWIDRGGARLTADGHPHTLGEGAVVLSRPGERNTYRWSTRGPTRHGYALFTMDGGPPPGPRVHRAAAGDLVLSTLRHLQSLETERPAGWEAVARAALGYAVQAFTTGATRVGPAKDPDLAPAVERSMLLVRTLWAPGRPLRAPRLADLARAAAVTPEHLCRVYRKEVGCTPVAALRLLRLAHGAALLARSNLTVAQVAQESGFDNPFHFSRAFAQAFGRSPTAFRRGGRPGVDLPDALRPLAAYLHAPPG